MPQLTGKIRITGYRVTRKNGKITKCDIPFDKECENARKVLEVRKVFMETYRRKYPKDIIYVDLSTVEL